MALDRTYANDGRLSPYPFMQAPGTPPFPNCCILAAGVCLSTPAAGIVCTGASLSRDVVSLTLGTLSGSGDVSTLCTIAAKPGTYGTSSDPGVYSAWMLAGDVPQAAVGSYAGSWPLDTACVEVSPRPSGAMSVLEVDGSPVQLGDVLAVRVGGLLGIDADRSDGVAAVYADIPDDYQGLFATSGPLTYRTVSGINSDVPGSDNPSGLLRLKIADVDGDSDSDTAGYVTAEVDFRGPGGTQVTELVQDGGSVSDTTRERLDRFGAAVFVTLNGHRSLPNCYADNDEAQS